MQVPSVFPSIVAGFETIPTRAVERIADIGVPVAAICVDSVIHNAVDDKLFCECVIFGLLFNVAIVCGLITFMNCSFFLFQGYWRVRGIRFRRSVIAGLVSSSLLDQIFLVRRIY